MTGATRGLRPGDVVAISYRGVTHEGLISGVAPVMVIHASMRRGMVAEEPLETFAAGRRVRRLGYYGKAPRAVVVGAARACLGEPYAMVGANCQTFTRRCHGVRRQSPDAPYAAAVVISLGALTGAILRRVRIGRMAAGAQ